MKYNNPSSKAATAVDAATALAVGVAVALLLAIAASSASAIDFTGTVINGTTGKPLAEGTAVVVNPSGGMAQEHTAPIRDGAFLASDLPGDASLYLIRVDYQGVMYTEAVQPNGADAMEVTVKVYEPTASWEGAHVTVPQLSASTHHDHLQIDRLIEVHNHADPPRTINGTDAVLKLRLPDDLLEPAEIHVSAMGIPIQRAAVETDVPGVYRIDYPLRPGTTRFTISMTVPYTGRQYTLEESLLYDVSELIVFNLDPTMSIETGGAPFETRETEGLVSYTARDLDAGTELALSFTGGSDQAAGGAMDATETTRRGGGTTVITVPNEAESLSLVMMLLILVLLFGFIAMAARGPMSTAERVAHMRQHRDDLLARLAKLDDLHAAGTVPGPVHQATRADLKKQLAAVMFQVSVAPPRPGSRHSGQGGGKKGAKAASGGRDDSRARRGRKRA